MATFCQPTQSRDCFCQALTDSTAKALRVAGALRAQFSKLIDRQAPPMFFLWPQYLWLLLALPLLPAAYVWLLRRRNKSAVRYSSLGVVRAASAGRNWRRHLPPALFLLACSGLLLAAARPVARVPLPWARSTILLAMDVSLSMSAYFSPSWTAFQADRGRHFSVIVDGVSN